MTESAPTPAGFNVEDWLTDAALPQESATVYKRADVVAELTELKRRIDIETRVEEAEPTAGSKRPATLIRQYEEHLKTFSDSALTVYVRALTAQELKDHRAATEERTKDMPSDEANLEFGFDLLATAIIGVKPAGATEVLPASFTADKVKAMRDAIGDTQMRLVLAARQQAQNGVPTVDADFLRKPSGTGTGQG